MFLQDLVYEMGPGCQVPARCTLYPLFARVHKKTTFHLTVEKAYRQISKWGVTKLKYIREDGTLPDNTGAIWTEYTEIPFRIEGETLLFEAEFPVESEYSFVIQCGTNEAMTVRVYALEDDLYGMIPLKGDMHLHSYASDGHQHPTLSAIRRRADGMDFLGLTDHQIYESSLIPIEDLKDSGTGLMMFPGEELHLPQHPDYYKAYPQEDRWLSQLPWVQKAIAMHLVNFGGSFSLNKYAFDDLDRFYKEVAEYEKNLPESLSPCDRYSVAVAEWAFDKVHEGHGLAIYPHPYWDLGNRRAVTEGVHQTMMERHKFDAFEASNNIYRKYNLLAMSDYSHQCGLGRKPSVVGSSDGHNADNTEGWSYTVLLAADFTHESVMQAVKERRSCAVMPVGPGKPPVVTGDLRMVKIVYFLLEQYFPEHDRRCALEGNLLEAVYNENGGALTGAVSAAAERVNAFRKLSYGTAE